MMVIMFVSSFVRARASDQAETPSPGTPTNDQRETERWEARRAKDTRRARAVAAARSPSVSSRRADYHKPGDRGRERPVRVSPSLRTGRADLPHPALQLVVPFRADGTWSW